VAHDARLLPLRIAAKEDRCAEYPLKRGNQAAILRPALLQPKDVEHFGSTAEGDGLLLLSHGQCGEKDRNQSVLTPGQAVCGMTSHLEQKLAIPSLM
jgi:hypothetical protein